MLVETLCPGEMSVISCGGNLREWASVRRNVQPARDVDVESIIQRVRDTRRKVVADVTSRTGPRSSFHIEAIPVLGPSGETHGVQVWVGEPDAVVLPPVSSPASPGISRRCRSPKRSKHR
ncbi:GAF domain-containing protein [Rhodococcus rhodnii]